MRIFTLVGASQENGSGRDDDSHYEELFAEKARIGRAWW